MSKTILITGTSTGFGRKTAETLSAAGHRVFATMRDPSGKNADHANALAALGITVLALDVTDTTSVDAAASAVLLEAGRIDVLVNNAGIAAAGISEAFTPEQVTTLFDVNVVGLHRTARAVLPAMRKQGEGLIINIGSILGRVTFPFFGLYGASKFAVEGMTDSLRYELSQLGVDVALVQPSAYPTNMYASVTHPADASRTAEYGDVGGIPGAMFDQFNTMLSADDAPNPQDIAKAIAGLVAAPAGTRAARTVVGMPYGADALNAAAVPVQSGVVEALGLGHLAVLKTA